MSLPTPPTPHCHPHSLDSASTPEAFADREEELGTGTLTVTDHGSLGACRHVYDLARERKLIPILGLEGYLKDPACPIMAKTGASPIKYHHFTVHFLDQQAYECGVRLLSKAPTERHGSERKPLFTWADIEELAGQKTTWGSGCLIGVVQRHLLDNGDPETARLYYERMRGLAGPGNWYVEVFPHVCDRNWVQGVFVTLDDGSKRKFGERRILRTNVGEVSAGDLAAAWGRKDRGGHRVLVATRFYRNWTDEDPPRSIQHVEKVEGYLQNECAPWCPDGDVQRGCNEFMLRMARRYGDPIIVSDDSHFARPDEKVVQDVRLMSSPGSSWRLASSYHRQSGDESFRYLQAKFGFSERDFLQMVDNARAWADRFRGFEWRVQPSLPASFYPSDTLWHLRTLIQKHGRLRREPVYLERLKKEIDLLHRNGHIDLLPYFFVLEEVTDHYALHGKLTGPGRGSAAGAYISYLLEITHVDPIRRELSLERFLTQDRIESGKLPDIDFDTPGRELLTDPETGWLWRRFGRDHVAQISTDQRLKLRQAVKDTARAMMGSVPREIELLTARFEMPPQGVDDHDHVFGYTDSGSWVEGSIKRDPALQEYVARYPDQWEVAQKALGLSRQKSKHACGFVISDRPLNTYIPLTTVGAKDAEEEEDREERVTAYTAPSVEAVGGLKYDFLVVNALRDLELAIRLIHQRRGAPNGDMEINGVLVRRHRLVPLPGGGWSDIWDLPEERQVFLEMSAGQTSTIFQFDTPGVRKWLRVFERQDGEPGVGSIDDLAAFTALDRPGPLDAMVRHPEEPTRTHNLLVEYARRSRGEQGSPDVFQIFDQLLPKTHGVMVFQEQLQFLYQQLTGCSLSEAETFRGLVAKKKMEKLLKYYDNFVERAAEKVGSREAAEAMWEFFKTWAQYGFNKSVDGTQPLYSCVDGREKPLQDFLTGDRVLGVDGAGQVIETEVVALHDHGTIMGWEVEFDDEYRVTCSANHRFLTERGQLPLWQIVRDDIPVLCAPREAQEASLDDGLRETGPLLGNGRTQKIVSSLSGSESREADESAHQAEWTSRGSAGMWGSGAETADLEAQSVVPDLRGAEADQRPGEDVATQQVGTDEEGGVRNSQEDVWQAGYPARASGAHPCMAKSEPGAASGQHREGDRGPQVVQDGGVVEVIRDADLAGRPNSLRRETQAGRLRQPGPQGVGGGGRSVPLPGRMGEAGPVPDRAGAGRDAVPGGAPARRRDVDPAVLELLQEQGRADGIDLAGLAHRDAPVIDTGSLVRRRAVRVRAVGPRRMYDLEVAHPQHNFLLPNGVVTSNSHAISYVIISYACAWLRHHYPLEWWCAVLTNATKNETAKKFWPHIHHLADLPDVRFSGRGWEIQGDRLRAPLTLLTGIGPKAHEQLMEHAPYRTLEDFARHNAQKGSQVKRNVVQTLILAGAMDGLFDPERYPTILDKLAAWEHELAKVRGERPKAVKVPWATNQLLQYQARKAICPIYSMDVRQPALAGLEGSRFDGQTWFHKHDRFGELVVLGGDQLHAFAEALLHHEVFAYTIGYVHEVKKRSGKNARGPWTNAQLTVDSCGETGKFTMWPRKRGEPMPADLEEKLQGAIVLLTLSRRPDRDPSVYGYEILAPPMKKGEKE